MNVVPTNIFLQQLVKELALQPQRQIVCHTCKSEIGDRGYAKGGDAEEEECVQVYLSIPAVIRPCSMGR
eukprot:CAMPEP_0115584406 /NCGR_PEP_ID=MMETSP0272-20121206/6668_1 /TAXON_ID=71861 /ORGANISM="Scrippsiella trochoidea, Strain CCMP3099" /LENGTH=68 /DNA_ID=CAMNT_0003019441 /DNA_START=138 /DNA_END=344 /DNA_ORIENTATION=-